MVQRPSPTGVLYGVVPGNYSLSHVYNHHKHDNSIEDVITVIDFRRDSFLAYLGYSYRSPTIPFLGRV